MRYIPVGGEAQFDRFAISNKFVTAERKAIPNAARIIPPPLWPSLKIETGRMITRLIYKRKFFEY